MARAGWMLLKWLVIPAALACVGYYVVGPRISSLAPSAPEKPAVQAPETPARQAASDNASDEHPTSYPAPDVTVTNGSSPQAGSAARHRRHHRPKAKAETPAPDQAPPVDQGGSGGAATGGGSGGDAGGSGGTTGGDDGGSGGTTGGL